MTLLGSTEIETNPRYMKAWVSESDIQGTLCGFPIQPSRAKLVFRQLDAIGSQNRSGTRMVVWDDQRGRLVVNRTSLDDFINNQKPQLQVSLGAIEYLDINSDAVPNPSFDKIPWDIFFQNGYFLESGMMRVVDDGGTSSARKFVEVSLTGYPHQYLPGDQSVTTLYKVGFNLKDHVLSSLQEGKMLDWIKGLDARFRERTQQNVQVSQNGSHPESRRGWTR